jgi:hypothetical protein
MKPLIASFDLEISHLPNSVDWQNTNVWDLWPFGISVGAIRLSDRPDPLVFYSTDEETGKPKQAMEQEDVQYLLEALQTYQRLGYRLFTWNGTSFDWQVIARITGSFEQCTELAKSSYDPCLQALCMLGFPIGLAAVAKALGLAGKEMAGGDAPKEWADGNYEAVIGYVKGDVNRLNDIVLRAIGDRGLKWVTKSGTARSLPLLHGFMTAEQALRLPLPDTSWMTKPITREGATEWWIS